MIKDLIIIVARKIIKYLFQSLSTKYESNISASLTVLGFYYPPEAGEKVSLEITILMALTFFMQVVSDMQPPSSQIPIISTYFTSIMVMVAASVVSENILFIYRKLKSLLFINL